MAYNKKENTGVLFKNDKKEKEKQPDYTGSALIDGKTIRISAWINEGTKGKYMSLYFQQPHESTKQSSNDVLPF